MASIKIDKKIAAIIVVAAICLVVVVAVLRSPRSDNSQAGPQRPQMSQQEETVYSVRSSFVTRQTLIDYISASGDVEATRSIEVYPDMGGKLVRTNVNLGSSVRRGQTIAQVDPSTPGVPYEISPVIAPLSGAITSQPLQPGTTVTTSTAIAIIGSIDDLQVTTNIPERYAGLLKTGMQAVITVDAYPGVEFPATVVRVSPVVDSISRTKELRLTFNENDDRINAGMYAKIRLYTTAKEDAIVVPETAILSTFGQQYVFLVSGDGRTAVQRQITTGMTVDGLTEVLSGLSDTDRVIIEGMHLLSDGARIRDISSSSSSSAAIIKEDFVQTAQASLEAFEESAV